MRYTVLRPSRIGWRSSLPAFALAVLCWLVGGYLTLHAQANAKWTIKGVLGMMDRASQDFHTLTADLEHVKYTAVVKDTSSETGHIFVRRDEKMRIEITKPDPRTILREGDNLFLFNPKINLRELRYIGSSRKESVYFLLDFWASVRRGHGAALQRYCLPGVICEDEVRAPVGACGGEVGFSPPTESNL